jgi:BlaI family transcriptional regulator, penicillinase repressor
MSPLRRNSSATPPSAGDLELLQLLWPDRELTIAQAHAAIGRSVGYTTIQTRLDRLVAKGLATRGQDRPARYRAAVTPAQAAALHMEPVVDHVHSGKVVPLVAGLLEQTPLTELEIAELRQLLQEAESRAIHSRKTRRREKSQPKED